MRDALEDGVESGAREATGARVVPGTVIGIQQVDSAREHVFGAVFERRIGTRLTERKQYCVVGDGSECENHHRSPPTA